MSCGVDWQVFIRSFLCVENMFLARSLFLSLHRIFPFFRTTNLLDPYTPARCSLSTALYFLSVSLHILSFHRPSYIPHTATPPSRSGLLTRHEIVPIDFSDRVPTWRVRFPLPVHTPPRVVPLIHTTHHTRARFLGRIRSIPRACFGRLLCTA